MIDAWVSPGCSFQFFLHLSLRCLLVSISACLSVCLFFSVFLYVSAILYLNAPIWLIVAFCKCVCLFVALSTCLRVLYLFLYLSSCSMFASLPVFELCVCFSTQLCVHLSNFKSAYLTVYLLTLLCACPLITVSVSFCLSTCPFVYLSICLFICMSIYLCQPVYMSDYLSVWLYIVLLYVYWCVLFWYIY